MSAKSVYVPRLLEIRAGVLPDVVDVLRGAGFELGRTLVGTGGGETAAVAATVVRQLRVAGACVVAREAAPTGEGVDRLVRSIRDARVETCVAVGGGRVIDAVKQAASLTQTPFVSVPTSLAHDGISSPIASVVDADGRRLSVGATMPEGVVVDLDVVRRAPVRTSRAGAADLLSNLTALEDWRLAAERGHDHVDGFSALIAENAARSFVDVAAEPSRRSLEALARGLVLSGLAMAVAASSRPCSGAEHLISHSLDRLLGPRARLHGEQVALGTLIAAVAQGSLTAELLAAYDAWSLPSSAADLGLERDVVVEAVIRARDTRPARYTILDEIDVRRRSVEELVDTALGSRRALRLAAGGGPASPRRAARRPEA
ncbi:MAG TPA: iron-containing alcohol dehydrogenase [Gaiellaceae bacterium]|nr:iron-containing alcohol dehydrogenase [Gaiellaceae bacterium]